LAEVEVKRVAGGFVLCRHRDDGLVSGAFLRPISDCFTLMFPKVSGLEYNYASDLDVVTLLRPPRRHCLSPRLDELPPYCKPCGNILAIRKSDLTAGPSFFPSRIRRSMAAKDRFIERVDKRIEIQYFIFLMQTFTLKKMIKSDSSFQWKLESTKNSLDFFFLGNIDLISVSTKTSFNL
jgi:hypothetical protein